MKTLFEGGLWNSCGTLRVWQSYGNWLYQRVGPSWEMRLAGIGSHTGCKFVNSYCYHCWVLGTIKYCVDVCLEKKKGRFWGEAGAGYLPSGSIEVKVWRRWNRFLLVDCSGWVVILGSVCVEISWVALTGKVELTV